MKTLTNCCKVPTASRRTMLATFGPSLRSPTLLRSGLVVEPAALEQLRALLRADLDVSRREQEHLVGHPLHAAVERVREAAREVDQPLRQLGVGALQVEDDRDRCLEP